MIAINVANNLTGIGTLLLGLAAVAGLADQRRRVKGLQSGQNEIHRAVNGNTTADRERIAQLTHALSEAGVPIPLPIGVSTE